MDRGFSEVREMDEINAELPQCDVAIVVGANDIVNPATQTDPTSLSAQSGELLRRAAALCLTALTSFSAKVECVHPAPSC